MVRPQRTSKHPDLQDAIKETAWKQISEYGAPALSLNEGNFVGWFSGK